MIEVVITTPDKEWLGSAYNRHVKPSLLTVLIGNKVEPDALPPGASGEEVLQSVKRRSAAQQVTALFFEVVNGYWKLVPVARLGVAPYVVPGALSSNYFYMVRVFSRDADQIAYLEDIGIAIGGEFVTL